MPKRAFVPAMLERVLLADKEIAASWSTTKTQNPGTPPQPKHGASYR